MSLPCSPSCSGTRGALGVTPGSPNLSLRDGASQRGLGHILEQRDTILILPAPDPSSPCCLCERLEAEDAFPGIPGGSGITTTSPVLESPLQELPRDPGAAPARIPSDGPRVPGAGGGCRPCTDTSPHANQSSLGEGGRGLRKAAALGARAAPPRQPRERHLPRAPPGPRAVPLLAEASAAPSPSHPNPIPVQTPA